MYVVSQTELRAHSFMYHMYCIGSLIQNASFSLRVLFLNLPVRTCWTRAYALLRVFAACIICVHLLRVLAVCICCVCLPCFAFFITCLILNCVFSSRRFLFLVFPCFLFLFFPCCLSLFFRFCLFVVVLLYLLLSGYLLSFSFPLLSCPLFLFVVVLLVSLLFLYSDVVAETRCFPLILFIHDSLASSR